MIRKRNSQMIKSIKSKLIWEGRTPEKIMKVKYFKKLNGKNLKYVPSINESMNQSNSIIDKIELN